MQAAAGRLAAAAEAEPEGTDHGEKKGGRFWHHGGRRALGIKHEGQWVVFYHPGDMNDAWKSPGYTDVSPEMRASAMHLGINLVRYAFDRWNDAVAKAGK